MNATRSTQVDVAAALFTIVGILNAQTHREAAAEICRSFGASNAIGPAGNT